MPSPGFEQRVDGAPAPLALGTMNFGKRTAAAEAERMMALALDRGVEVFDTANVYNDGESERLVGRALRAAGRDRVRVATKVGLGTQGGKREGLAPERVLAAATQSRERLGIEVIDLYYLHAPDARVPIGETLGAIGTLLAEGTVRSWGVSNHAAWQILEIQTLCAARGMAPPIASQVLYNMLVRQLEIEYLRFARSHGIHTTVYNALAGGLLSGRYRPGDPVPAGSRFDGNAMYQRRYWTERFLALVQSYGTVAEAEHVPLADLAYGWLAGQPGVDSILIGPASIEQLEQAIAACARPLSPEARSRIDETHRAFCGTDATYAR